MDPRPFTETDMAKLKEFHDYMVESGLHGAITLAEPPEPMDPVPDGEPSPPPGMQMRPTPFFLSHGSAEQIVRCMGAQVVDLLRLMARDGNLGKALAAGTDALHQIAFMLTMIAHSQLPPEDPMGPQTPDSHTEPDIRDTEIPEGI